MRRDVAVVLMVALALAAGAVRVGTIQGARGDRLRDQARQQHTARWVVPAQRGDILDANGRVLVGSIRRPSIFVDASMLGDPAFAAHSVAPVLGLDPYELERLLIEKKDDGFVWVKRSVSDAELAAVEHLRDQRGLRAFGVEHEPKRAYPFGRLAGPLLGFVGAEQRGMAGLEQQYNDVLAGTDGQRISVVDVRRRRLRCDPANYTPPRDGESLVLTIDAHIQQRTETHLREAVERFKAEWGAAIVMDPRTGEVLAMASVPDYDAAQPFEDVSRKPGASLERLRNRAIADAFEPGSIFKPFLAAPAVEAGVTRLDEPFAVNGPTRQFGGRTIHDTHVYGTLSLTEVISKSSNIGMGLLGARLGNAAEYEFVRRFGFGDLTGIELPGEHAGLLQDFSRWTSFSTQSIPIGQEIAITSIQIASAVSALANGGILYRPRIIRGIVNNAGETVEDHSRPIPIRRVLREEVVTAFRKQALGEVVRTGTGRNAAIADYQVFGKTGTAQVAHPNGRGYIPGAYTGSFMGGAPLDEPRAVVVVSLRIHGKAQYYGGTVAAPAAGEILADALTYMGVPPDRKGDVASGPKRPLSASDVSE